MYTFCSQSQVKSQYRNTKTLWSYLKELVSFPVGTKYFLNWLVLTNRQIQKQKMTNRPYSLSVMFHPMEGWSSSFSERSPRGQMMESDPQLLQLLLPPMRRFLPCASHGSDAWKSITHDFLDDTVEKMWSNHYFLRTQEYPGCSLNYKTKTRLVVQDQLCVAAAPLAHKSPSYSFAARDSILVARHWLYWKYLYHRSQ